MSAGCEIDTRVHSIHVTRSRTFSRSETLVRSSCMSKRKRAAATEFSLPALLAPLPLHSFLAEHCERAPVLARGPAGRFAGLEHALRDAPAAARAVPAVELDEFDSAAAREEATRAGAGGVPVHGQDVRLVRTSRSDSAEETFFVPLGTELDAETVHAASAAGCTVALRAVNLRSTTAANVAAAVSAELGLPCGANLYVTPPHAQGLAVHFDDHDVVVLQLAGSKAWRVYPAECGARLPRLFSARTAPRCDGAAPTEHMLSAGDVLYIPRGFPHAAATREGASTHLTLAIECWPAFEWEAALHVAVRLASGCAAGWAAAEVLLHAAVRQLADTELSLRAACLGPALVGDEGAAIYGALVLHLSSMSLRDAREAALRFLSDEADAGFSWLAHVAPWSDDAASWRSRADGFYDALLAATSTVAGEAYDMLRSKAGARPWGSVRVTLSEVRSRYLDAHAGFGREMRALHESAV